MKITEDQLRTYEAFIFEFNNLEPIPNYAPTIFEISGYPHYEDVISNVLQFFFKSDYEHGFSSIFVESLLDAVDALERKEQQSDFSVLNVEREVTTKKNNRIDLVIESENRCIAIENKIYHHLYHNDLQDYQNYIETEYPGYEHTFIVLSHKQKDKPRGWDDNKFKFITYHEFFDKLEKRLGKALPNADTKVVVYLSDLIKTLRNMSKRTQLTMEFLKFMDKNREDIESLYDNAFKKFKSEVEDKANEIEELVDYKGTDFTPSTFRAKGKLKYVRYFERVVHYQDSECKIQIKLRFTPKVYRIEVWDRKSSDEEVFGKFIKERLGIDVSEQEGHQDDWAGSVIIEEFEYGEEPDKVAEELNQLIEKLAQ